MKNTLLLRKLIRLYEKTIATVIVLFGKHKYIAIGTALLLVISITSFALFHDTLNNKAELALDNTRVVAEPSNLGGKAEVSTNQQLVENKIDETTADKMLSGVNDKRMASVKVWSIFVDGEEVASTLNQTTAEKVLKDLQDMYIAEMGDSEPIDIHMKEKVEIKESFVKVSEQESIMTEDEMLEYIILGTDEKRIHIIEKGDTFWDIAIKYGVDVSDIEKANPKINPSRIKPGMEISLVVPKPLITVITVENRTYTENIEFEVVYEDNPNIYKGEYSVKKQGKNGEREVNANIIRENGNVVDTEVLTENRLSEPVTKIVYRGTKNPPPRIGTGSFVRPTSRGYITSPFGLRWGRRHNGVDIGIPVGTTVKAADGGKVIWVGTKGAYGKTVMIDHGENKVTLYAHNSGYKVKVGDMVYQGQAIALSGNTGRSTGPHLHFEVRVNGVPKNPVNYVKF